MRVYRRFIKEAERKAYVWHDGRLKDRVEYRLLRAEWKKNC
jgi:RimJ/RimL family protein N-acetyltransferase